MHIRILLAIPDERSQAILRSMVDEAMCLIPLDISVQAVDSKMALMDRIHADLDDVVLLDWSLVDKETPNLVKQILSDNPRMRVVALVPMKLRQYRQATWNAGACNSIPKEIMDQEWLSSLLCVINRAMEREARILAAQAAASAPVS